LAQGAQPVVARRIGGAERRAGAAGQFVDHIALRRREGFPVARGFGDVVIARQDPELRAFAPVARIFGAEFRVVGKRVRIDQRRIKVEGLHFLKTPGADRKLSQLFAGPRDVEVQ
jgi:hypothetical protein